MQFAMPRMTPMVRRLLIVNAGVFLATFVAYLVSTDGDAWAPIRRWLGVTPSLWSGDGVGVLPVWQILTYGFLHDVHSPFHIIGNMLFLYFLGTMLEGIVGGRRLLLLFLTSLILAGLVTLLLGVLTGERLSTVGASGAVMGVVVATAALRPKTRIIFLLFPISLATLAAIYVGMDVFYGLLSFKGRDTGVAHFAHLAGAAWGFVAVKMGWVWWDPVAGFERMSEKRSARKEATEVHRVDELLAKIHRHGIQSLSPGEREFLKRSSTRGGDPRG